MTGARITVRTLTAANGLPVNVTEMVHPEHGLSRLGGILDPISMTYRLAYLRTTSISNLQRSSQSGTCDENGSTLTWPR